MSHINSEMSRAVKSTETVRNIKKYIPSFYDRGQRRQLPETQLVWNMLGTGAEILRAFDLVGEWPENYGTLCAAQKVAMGFCQEAEAEGYSNELCSYVRNTLGYLRRCRDSGEVPPEAPLDGMGNPNLLLGSALICEPRYKWFQAIGTHFLNVPQFNDDPVSPPYDADLEDPRLAEHYKTQIRATLLAQISFLEQQTGKKLDMGRFSEIMKNSQEAMKYWYRVLELRKAVPCPMGSEDYFTAIIPFLYLAGDREAVDFYQDLYTEIKDRVDRGIGVIPEEKYRFGWLGIPPWFNMGLFNYLQTLGAVVCVESTYYVGQPVEVDLPDPLENLVERTWKTAQYKQKQGSEINPDICNPGVFSPGVGAGLVKRWVFEYKLDGAIGHRTRSCRATSMGQLHVKNKLAEIDVPMLIFESDMVDPRAWADAQVKMRFQGFLETIDARRSKKFS
ncbi:MAG: 2-hydroxyacyl-CoA dehydratase family protein [Thermodesulfobacteriota bacterium]|nr:2-hydroxyacyl-CoA dehydratase family protein [Thermodesulfobacteriota bacterium]